MSLLPHRPEGYSDVHAKHVIGFDCRPPAASFGVAAPVSCGIAAALRSRTGQYVSGPATTPAKLPRAELVEADRLVARLVWHQVRPRPRTTSDTRHRIGSSHDSKAGLVMAGAPGARGATRSAAIRDAAWPEASPASLETLFRELARRRLHRLDARKEF